MNFSWVRKWDSSGQKAGNIRLIAPHFFLIVGTDLVHFLIFRTEWMTISTPLNTFHKSYALKILVIRNTPGSFTCQLYLNKWAEIKHFGHKSAKQFVQNHLIKNSNVCWKCTKNFKLFRWLKNKLFNPHLRKLFWEVFNLGQATYLFPLMSDNQWVFGNYRNWAA